MKNITTYPRKGTVTMIASRGAAKLEAITTYPRKGTVTLAISS